MKRLLATMSMLLCLTGALLRSLISRCRLCIRRRFRAPMRRVSSGSRAIGSGMGSTMSGYAAVTSRFARNTANGCMATGSRAG